LRCDVDELRARRRIVHLDAEVHDIGGRMVVAATGSLAVAPGGAT
jgi:hypothetical protein